jgi:glycerol transport system ATP-binding protein
MNDGEVVQIGTPVDLFERPQHTFVGHFIGSPGMNVLPCEVDNGKPPIFSDRPLETANAGKGADGQHRIESASGRNSCLCRRRPAGRIVSVADAGRFRIVDAVRDGVGIKLLVPEGAEIPTDSPDVPSTRKTRQRLRRWLAGGRTPGGPA